MSTPASAERAKAPKLRRPKPPPLFRTARWVHRAGTILIVLLIVFLATVAYSTSKLSIQTPNGNGNGNRSNATLGFNVVTYSEQVNITNNGFYPITGFSTAVLATIAGGPVVGTYQSNSTTVAAGAKFPVVITEEINVGPGYPGQMLLTENATIGVQGWINATIGYLVGFSIGFSPGNNISWSAPFSGYTVGATVAGSSAETTVRFYNSLGQAIDGTFAIALVSVGGTTCGTGTLTPPAPVAGNSGFQGTTEISVSAGCSPAFAEATFTAASYGFTLPVAVLA